MSKIESHNINSLSGRVAFVIARIDETIPVIAQKLGVNKNTVTAYKKGDADPKGRALENLVKVYRVNPVWLLSGTGPIYKDDKSKQKTEMPTSESRQSIVIEHIDLVKEFEDKEEALEANRNLIKLEKLDPEEFYATTGRIRGTVKKVMRQKSGDTQKETEEGRQATPGAVGSRHQTKHSEKSF